jgi:hypothetical protein
MSNTDQTRIKTNYHHGKCLSVTALQRGRSTQMCCRISLKPAIPIVMTILKPFIPKAVVAKRKFSPEAGN